MEKFSMRHPDTGSIASLVLGFTAVSVGIYLSYGSIGTPLSNASGTVIRSTVTSFYYSGFLVLAVYLSCMDLLRRMHKMWPKGIRLMIYVGLSIAAVSSPFLVYYNFYFSYTAVISGATYTVYPYAVQAGIPFLIGLFMAFMGWTVLLGYRLSRRKVKASAYTLGIIHKTSSENRKKE